MFNASKQFVFSTLPVTPFARNKIITLLQLEKDGGRKTTFIISYRLLGPVRLEIPVHPHAVLHLQRKLHKSFQVLQKCFALNKPTKNLVKILFCTPSVRKASLHL
ncbi:hypothetical protein AVEN_256573-1 [Araneus ventricosus]|uniref:Uncharacterized protein n=1 Tax=Araneus ventricosus TaxID=182803 RepID=A0A4Y2J262_ARAVE|nr:hypothetical protein AVEN_256573-1 [Araneus ventricosus]